MIVIDPSALLELLLATDRAGHVAARVLAADETLHAPHLLDVEIAQTLRRLVQLRQITASRAEQALEDHADLLIDRYAHQELLMRIWELRNSVAAYDAAYIALAEALNAPLLTCDRKLAKAHGHGAKLEIVQ